MPQSLCQLYIEWCSLLNKADREVLYNINNWICEHLQEEITVIVLAFTLYVMNEIHLGGKNEIRVATDGLHKRGNLSLKHNKST